MGASLFLNHRTATWQDNQGGVWGSQKILCINLAYQTCTSISFKGRGELRTRYYKLLMRFIFTAVFLKVNEHTGAFWHMLHHGSLAEGGLSGLFKFRSNAWLTAPALLQATILAQRLKVITVAGACRAQQRSLTPSRRHLISTVYAANGTAQHSPGVFFLSS